jgi:hypothetical protein
MKKKSSPSWPHHTPRKSRVWFAVPITSQVGSFRFGLSVAFWFLACCQPFWILVQVGLAFWSHQCYHLSSSFRNLSVSLSPSTASTVSFHHLPLFINHRLRPILGFHRCRRLKKKSIVSVSKLKLLDLLDFMPHILIFIWLVYFP